MTNLQRIDGPPPSPLSEGLLAGVWNGDSFAGDPEGQLPTADRASHDVYIMMNTSSCSFTAPPMTEWVVEPPTDDRYARRVHGAPAMASAAAMQSNLAAMVRVSGDSDALLLTPEVRTFAEKHGVTAGIEAMCELAYSMLPAVKQVSVEVICDPEDGEFSLHVTVHTSAEADEVLEAEERLYDALFDRVEPTGRRLLSLGYIFRE